MSRKGILFSTFLIQFWIVFIITILGILDWIQIKDGFLDTLFYLIVTEVIASVIALFKGTDFFQEEKTEGGTVKGKSLPSRVVRQKKEKMELGLSTSERKTHKKISMTAIEYNKTYDSLRSRFHERDEFLKKNDGCIVNWSGYVNSVNERYGVVSIQLNFENKASSEVFFANFPDTLKSKAYALQHGDKINFFGRLNTKSMPSSPSVDSDAFELEIGE